VKANNNIYRVNNVVKKTGYVFLQNMVSADIILGIESLKGSAVISTAD
jgi:hypothetical protein